MSNKPPFSRPGFGGSRRDDDEEENKGRPADDGPRSSSPFNRGGKPDDKPGAPKPSSSPFASRSPFGSKPGNKDDEDDDLTDNKSVAFGSKYGSPSKPAAPFGGNKPGEPPKPGSPFGGSKQSDQPKPGSPFGGNKPGDQPRPGSSFGGSKQNEPPKPGSPFGGNKPGDQPRPGSSFGGSKQNEPPRPGSPFGGSKQSDQPKPGSSFGGSKQNEPPRPGSPFGGNKPGDPSRPASTFGSSKPAEKKDDRGAARKDDKPAGGGPLGGVRLPFGGSKPAEKKDDRGAARKDDKPTGGGLLGGVRLPFGAKPAEKKDDRGTARKDDKPAGGGLLGGVRLPFGGSKPAEKKDDRGAARKDDKPAGGGPLGGVRLPFGAKPAEKKDDRPAAASRLPSAGGKPAEAKKDDKPGGGFLGGRLPFGKKPDAPAEKTSARPEEAKRTTSALPSVPPKPGDPKRTSGFGPAAAPIASPKSATAAPDLKKQGSKIPPARGEKVARPLEKTPKQITVQGGLSLDQKLDLVGYAFIIIGVLIFFGVFLPGKETVDTIPKGLARLIAQLFGNARYVLWTPFLAVGLWLFVRRFTENPLIIKAHRILGWFLLLAALSTTLQIVALIDTKVEDMPALIKASNEVAKADCYIKQCGGGFVGGEVYKLIANLGDGPSIVLLVAIWLVGSMLAFSITMTEIAVYVKSVFRWFRRVRGSYLEQRRIAAEARAAAQAAKAAAQPPLTIEKPAAAGVGPGAAPAAAALAGPLRKPAAIPERTGTPEKALPAGTPALVPAAPPPPLGSKPVEAADSGRRSTPARPFGTIPARAVEDDEPEEETVADVAGTGRELPTSTPLARPTPMPLGSRSTSTAAAQSAETKVEAKTDTSPARPGPFGPRPVSQPDKPKPGPFGAAPSRPAADSGREEARSDQEPKPAVAVVRPEPVGRAEPEKIEARADDAAGQKTTEAKPVDTQAVSTTAGVVPVPAQSAEPKAAPSPEKPAGRFGSLFGGSKPKTDDSKKPDEGNAANDKPGEVEAKPATPAASKPSPFGSLFGASKAASGAPAKPADAIDADKPAETAKPAAPVEKPATPVGRPTPFGTARPTSSPVAKSAVDADEDEKDMEADKPAASTFKPATPVGNRPNPFGGGRPTSSPVAKPAGDDDADEDEMDMESDKPAASTFKPATPVGRPNPFGGGRPGSSPIAKPAVDDDSEEDDQDVEIDKPARPIGNRPSPFGAPPSAAPRPAPKPSLATHPTIDDEDDEPDNGPQYVDDDLDDMPRSDGPRPTISGRPGTPPASMPRPANPITPRPRPGGKPFAELDMKSPAKPGESAGSPVPKPTTDQNAAPAKPGNPLPQAETKSAAGVTTSAKPADAPKSGPTPTTAAPATSAPPAPKPAAAQSQPAAPESPKPAPPVEGVIYRSRDANGWVKPEFRQLLEPGSQQKITDDVLQERARAIEETLRSFGAPGNVIEINTGPVITQFGVEPDYLVSRQGKKTRVKVSAIARLDADLALALAARSIRIEAPVPGKGYVGIEVPNTETALVGLRDIMDSREFEKISSKLPIALGKSVDGAPIAADLTQMPHLLIAGTTGSGKSVCVNAIIACLLLENTPDDMKFIMVDPKRVELTGYNGIPHLVSPVVVDLERIVGVLKWVTREMEERYKKFSQAGARNITDFNGRVGPHDPKLPYLVVIIDELADLMMLAPEETEKVLTRLAQMARATGIHLIISTQRPSVDVVTGLIKANFPARISFAVASSVDSRVILDQPGAEKLLGRGDMLYQSPDAAAPLRMQGVFVSDAEINRITRYWKSSGNGEADTKASPNFFDLGSKPEPVQSRAERFGPSISPSKQITGPFSDKPGVSNVSSNANSTGSDTRSSGANGSPEDDELYDEAVKLVKQNKASVQLLQRRLRVNYARASRLIELMKQRGVIDGVDTESVPDSEESQRP